jgi:hypothetical protein
MAKVLDQIEGKVSSSQSSNENEFEGFIVKDRKQ